MNGFTHEVLSRGLKVMSAPIQAANWSGPSHGLWVGRASARYAVRAMSLSAFAMT